MSTRRPTTPTPADEALRWFLYSYGARSRTVACPKGGEADTVAALVAAIKDQKEIRIVVAAPTRGEVVEVAGVLAAKLGRNPSGFPRVGMGLRNADFPDDVADAHPTLPVYPSMVPVRSITAARAFAPVCDLMIVTGIHPMTALAVADAARNAGRLIILRPSAAECPQPAAHAEVEGTCLDEVRA